MREIVHLQAGQCGNQIGAKVNKILAKFFGYLYITLSSFGKLFRMNMVSIQLVPIMAIPIFNLNASMSITMKQPVKNLFINEKSI
jgi:hypothetical protein